MVKMKTDMRRLSLRRMSLSTFPTREIIGTSTSRRLSLPTLRTRSPIATSIDGKSMELPWVNGAMSMDSACPLIKPNTSALKTSSTSTKLRLTVEQDVAAWQPENVHHRQPRVNIKKMFFRNKTVEKRQDSYNLDNVPKRHSI
ncbi:hypothetical protein DPMN_119917 [Dreissena polymorpha]|uniref:Uncharacterized protein n=1 Tax=Dreissena polymorpha TaxID=45954 RepID=A0A9D4JRP7_DREPO|nr:hypothetical protein DPMN_119917 [Dreissena polymorpha]